MMKRSYRSMLGVTLLEIMLVLAIAAMIIVMSIRYYQNASNSQQANAALGQIQMIMAAADNLGMNGGYSANAKPSNVAAVVGSKNMMTPNNQSIVYTATGATTYTLSVPLTKATCPLVKGQLSTSPRISDLACNDGTLVFTYTSTF